jgi:hypothetical protein
MKKTVSFFGIVLLLTSVSYGAWHSEGNSIGLSTYETPRYDGASDEGDIYNTNTTFTLKADAYTTYHVPNPSGYGDQVSEVKLYYNSDTVRTIKAETGSQPGGGYSYDVKKLAYYTGQADYWSYSLYIGTPLGYRAGANAYIEWVD